MSRKKQPVMVNGVKSWVCSKCKAPKPAADFCKHRGNANGLNSHCKDCQRPINVAYRAKPGELEKARANARRWNKANPGRYRANCKKWQTKNKPGRSKYGAKYAKENPAKRSAKNAVTVALKSGALTKPTKCEMCPSERPLDGHHDSYDRDRWLVVTWLCKRCHRWTHARRSDQIKGIWL